MNAGSDVDDVTSGGKLFHVCAAAAATWNARSSTVERRVVGTNVAGVDADRSRRHKSTSATFTRKLNALFSRFFVNQSLYGSKVTKL